MTYLPTYLQYVQGVSATESGLRLLPMVIGRLATSLTSGALVSRTGRYKLSPILGSAVMIAGTSFLGASVAMLVLGAGIGLMMQVLIIVVQSTVSYADLGVATSGVTFLRTIGSSFGVAVFGTNYANNLSGNLAAALAANPLPAGTPPSAVQSRDPGPRRRSHARHRRRMDAVADLPAQQGRQRRDAGGDRARGYLDEIADEFVLSERGRADFTRLVRAWQDWLAEQLADWQPETQVDLVAALDRMAERIIKETAGIGRTEREVVPAQRAG